MRRLVVCCDGTWSTPDLASVTNVRRLRNALAEVDADGHPQLAFYASGAGTTGGVVARLRGGALGDDLDDRILEAYRWLATTYRPGDEIALFGFSRGAYTVRSLAGMVRWCGLLDTAGLDGPEITRRVARLYREGYRGRRAHGPPLEGALAHRPEEPDVPITFVGVWDTVGALGIPDHLGWLEHGDPGRYTFHDVGLDPRIPHARHAVAVDERRGPFAPTLWSDPAPGQDTAQVWFPGGHLDVGGGHEDRGLADVTLRWMLDEAERVTPLRFRTAARAQIHPDPLAVAHDDNRHQLAPLTSLVFDDLVARATGFVWRPEPRAVPLVDPARRRPDVDDAVYTRQAEVPITSGPYRPTRVVERGAPVVVAVAADVPWNDTGLYLRPGDHVLAAAGRWTDDTWSCGPAGGDVGPAPAQLPEAALGLGLRLVATATRARPRPAWAFPGLVRRPELARMRLVAVIADGGPGGHQVVDVGAGPVRVTVRTGGYLYAWANDAWSSYDDNDGAVELSVRRA
ncbi:DUF2235 domain-containing protein [Actinomycetospora aeridis]|uniref:DUF2235 domain-containing protein n=1 Tax=Actinomycetospora aeridis TaxID=3129231 RepID=A0ABU8NBC7_9PSEU